MKMSNNKRMLMRIVKLKVISEIVSEYCIRTCVWLENVWDDGITLSIILSNKYVTYLIKHWHNLKWMDYKTMISFAFELINTINFAVIFIIIKIIVPDEVQLMRGQKYFVSTVIILRSSYCIRLGIRGKMEKQRSEI